MIHLSLYLTYHSKKVFSLSIRRLQSQQQFLKWAPVQILVITGQYLEFLKKNA